MGGDECAPVRQLVEHDTALLTDVHRAAEHSAPGSRAAADDHSGIDNRDLCLEPGLTRDQVTQLRFAVDSSLPSLFMAEVLDRVGQVDTLLIDPSGAQGSLQELPGGTDEGLALTVLVVSRLFSYQHEPC